MCALQIKRIKDFFGISIILNNTIPFGLVCLLLFISCEDEKIDPKIETTSLDPLTSTSYTASAKIVERGDYKILDHGFVYHYTSYGKGMASTLNINDKISLGDTISGDSFTSTFNVENIEYFSNSMCCVRAYITNELGTVYGDEIVREVLKIKANKVIPNIALVGDTISISGINFSSVLSQNKVTFNDINAEVISATNTCLRVIVPKVVTSYLELIDIKVYSGGQYSVLNEVFRFKAVAVSFSPSNGSWNTPINISGSNLDYAKLYFNDTKIEYYSHSSTYISASIPYDFKDKKFKIFIESGGIKTEVPGGFFSMSDLTINPLTNLKYLPGAQLVFSGSGYHPSNVYNKLFFGSTIITADYDYSKLKFTIPVSTPSGDYDLKITNGIDTVTLVNKISVIIPKITGMSPNTGYPGSEIIFQGENFYMGSTTNTYISFDGIISKKLVSVDSTTIVAQIPYYNSGNHIPSLVFGNFYVQGPISLNILEPQIISISPTSGAAGSTATIYLENFKAGCYVGVTLNYKLVNVISTSDNQINIQIPLYYSSGTYIVEVGLENMRLSKKLTFTIP